MTRASATGRAARLRAVALGNLWVAFAFTVMADPVSSVAYALEAPLRELDGELSRLLPTMMLVLIAIALVGASYHQLIRRYPGGGAAAEGLAEAFGEGYAFVPIGALLVDFTLTICVSVAAAASALIAYIPELAPWRTPLALGLAAAVAIGTSFGHRGRVVFATATLLFITASAVVIARGALAEPGPHSVPVAGDIALVPLLLAMPLGMALATGVEAPSSAIAQLGHLGPRARVVFGQATIWVMLAVVSGLTLGFAALAAHLGVGVPGKDSTLLADVGRRATGGDSSFAMFQAASAMLLLAAAASSYLAASGLLKALALHGEQGLVPRVFGRTNRVDVPYWGLALLLGTSAAVVLAAGARDQELVQFYAVAVFASFLGALAAAGRLSARDGRPLALAVNLAGTAVVALVLVLNLRRGTPAISLAAAAAVSIYVWRVWVARGRPTGVPSALR